MSLDWHGGEHCNLRRRATGHDKNVIAAVAPPVERMLGIAWVATVWCVNTAKPSLSPDAMREDYGRLLAETDDIFAESSRRRFLCRNARHVKRNRIESIKKIVYHWALAFVHNELVANYCILWLKISAVSATTQVVASHGFGVLGASRCM